MQDQLTLYIGFLINNNRQSSTVKSYISANRSVLLENNITIQENSFLISALTRACKLNTDVVCARLLIGRDLLELLLKETPNRYMAISQPYLAVLVVCVLSTAYFRSFRIGELTKSQHSVKAKDVQIATNKCKIRFILRSSKTHGKYAQPKIIKINSSNCT